MTLRKSPSVTLTSTRQLLWQPSHCSRKEALPRGTAICRGSPQKGQRTDALTRAIVAARGLRVQPVPQNPAPGTLESCR